MKILKIPSGLGGMTKKAGQEKAPDSIEAASKNIYLKESGMLAVLDFIEITLDSGHLEERNSQIENAVIKTGLPLILIGGDHSITYPGFRAFASSSDKPGLVVFDSHPDCMNNFSPPTHEDYLRVLIEEGSADPNSVILVGLRNMHAKEHNFLRSKKIKYFDMREIAREGVMAVSDAVMSVAKSYGSLYISIDIDAADPAFAPGTGYIEAGGLSARELVMMVQRLRLLKNFRIADIVEVNPDKDVNGMTSALAGKLLVELC